MPYLRQGLGDWCLIASDGSVCICKRIEKGSLKSAGNAGWLHAVSGTPVPTELKPKRIIRTAAWQKLYEFYRANWRFQEATDYGSLLYCLGAGMHHDCYMVPVYNYDGRIRGIQRVDMTTHKKRFISNSRTGLFKPLFPHNSSMLVVTEGVSDTAVAHYLGYHVVGIPSAGSCLEFVIQYVQLHHMKSLLIISDNNDVGVASSQALSKLGLENGLKNSIIIPEHKDLRAWVEYDGHKKTNKRITDFVKSTGLDC